MSQDDMFIHTAIQKEKEQTLRDKILQIVTYQTDEGTGGYKLSFEEVDEIIDLLLQELKRVEEETSKAFGGCKKCYGKGYATYAEGYRVAPDFEGDEEYIGPIKEKYLHCSCDRGKQIQKILSQKEDNS